MSAADCTCWRFPTAQAEVVPLAWACLHRDVRVVTREGVDVVGWGAAYEVLDHDGVLKEMVVIEDADGDVWFLTPDEVTSVTPVVGLADEAAFSDAVATAIAQAIRGGSEENLRLIIDDHRTVEVDVRHEWHGCMPSRSRRLTGARL